MEPSKPTDKQAIIDMVKKIVWPDIDLQNINLTVLLPDATLRIKDLDFQMSSGKQGTLHVASVEHPALALYPLHDISAKLAINGAVLTIDELKLPPNLEVQHLKADAGEYGKGKIAASTRILSGAASVDLDAKADLSGEHPLIDTTIDVVGVDEKLLGLWIKNLPPAKATLRTLHITAKGDPMLPRQLAASLLLDVRDLAYDKYHGEGLVVEAKLADGKVNVSQLSATTGGNRVEITTLIDAPSDWPAFAKAPMQVNWKLTAPTLQTIAGLPMKLNGSINGEGSAKLENQALKDFDAHVTANDVAVDAHKLRSLDATAKGDLKRVNFNAAALADAGDGKLDAKGEIGLEAGTQSHAEWNLVVPKPDELTKSLGIAWPPDVGVGEVRSDGALDFDLAKVKAQDFDAAKGKGTLMIQQPTWKSAPCEQITADWKLESGKATVNALDVKLPGDNTIHLEAVMDLAGTQAFDASLSVQTKDLAALRAWLDAAEVKQLQSGSVTLNWKGSGKLKDGLKLGGEASLKVDALRYETLPDAANLDTGFAHDLEGADFKNFTAKLGPWSASMTGTVSKTGVDLKNIEAFHETKKLITGEIQVPLDLAAKPVPVDQTKPMHVRIETTERHSLADLAQMAKVTLPPELAGLVSVSVALNGTLPQLQSRIEVKAEELHLPKTPTKEPGSMNLLVTLDDGALHLAHTASVKPLEPFTADITAKMNVMALLNDPKLAMETPFEASVTHHQPNIAFLKPMVPMLDELEGSVLVDFKADGTGNAPHVHGSVIVDVPKVTPHDPELPLVKDLKLHLTGEDTMVKLESLHALVAGGVVDISGTCDLAALAVKPETEHPLLGPASDGQERGRDFSPDQNAPGLKSRPRSAGPSFDVSLKARDLLVVRNGMMSLRTDADLNCKGVPTAANVTGSIGLTRGRVFQEVNFLPLNKMMNDLPPLPDEKASKPSKEPNASPLPPMLKDWNFDIAVKTKDNIRLLGNVLNGGVKIDINVGGNGAAPQVVGEVDLEHAVLNLPFSTLRVRKGVVSLAADKPLAPTLELFAESTVDAYEVDLRGYGPVTDPKIHFTSTPPLPPKAR